MVLQRLYHYIKGPNPLHPSVLDGRLRPLTFRRFADADLPGCMELYSQNEAGRFPQGVKEKYAKSLLERSSYFLVVEDEGQIIASGGLAYWERNDIVVLCFGLVRPDHHGKGIGTALLLARLALLKSNCRLFHVLIFAVEKSIYFYRRFGFKDFNPWQDSQGDKHPSGHLRITGTEIYKCRRLLKEHGILLPEDEDQVPFNRRETAAEA